MVHVFYRGSAISEHGRISLPYHTILDFLRSKRNSLIDGQNFAGAYFIPTVASPGVTAKVEGFQIDLHLFD